MHDVYADAIAYRRVTAVKYRRKRGPPTHPRRTAAFAVRSLRAAKITHQIKIKRLWSEEYSGHGRFSALWLALAFPPSQESGLS